MRRSLYIWGAILSLFYFGFVYWAVGERLPGLRGSALNEIGDFLAGIFSPLAFLWLVLGFIQQGTELRISSDALELQTKELRRSVAEQAALASATERSLRNQELALEPVFQLRFTGLTDEFEEGERIQVCSFKLLNAGAPCEHVVVSLMATDGSEAITHEYPIVSREGTYELTLKDSIGSDDESELRVSYIKFNGAAGTQIFDLRPTPYSEPGEWYVAVSKRILAL